MKTIYEISTGQTMQVDSVDAREILKHSDLYSEVEPIASPADGKDPRDMTVAQLKAALDAKGIQYPSTAPKADLVELAEVAEIKG